MELMIVAGKVVPILQLEHGVAVVTVYAGSFMTSLDMGDLLSSFCFLMQKKWLISLCQLCCGLVDIDY